MTAPQLCFASRRSRGPIPGEPEAGKPEARPDTTPHAPSCRAGPARSTHDHVRLVRSPLAGPCLLPPQAVPPRGGSEVGRETYDRVATLLAFPAEAVGRARRDFLAGEGGVGRVVVGGSGARNPSVLRALSAALAVPVQPFDTAGVPAAAAEAMAFALMGRNALLGLPNHLPRCTGAAREAVLGEIVPAGGGAPR